MSKNKWWIKDWVISDKGFPSDFGSMIYTRNLMFLDLREIREELVKVTKNALEFDFLDLAKGELYGKGDDAYLFGSLYTRRADLKRNRDMILKKLPPYINIIEKEYEESGLTKKIKAVQADMSQYLAYKGDILFNIIDKAFDPKITVKNCKLSNEKMQQVQVVLLKALEYQNELVQDKFKNGRMSETDYSLYIKSYKRHKSAARSIAENWKNKEKSLVKSNDDVLEA